jgi:hypothetical protein
VTRRTNKKPFPYWRPHSHLARDLLYLPHSFPKVNVRLLVSCHGVQQKDERVVFIEIRTTRIFLDNSHCDVKNVTCTAPKSNLMEHFTRLCSQVYPQSKGSLRACSMTFQLLKKKMIPTTKTRSGTPMGSG